jgi:hypothetical protein
MIGPQDDLYKLTPDEHSIGLVKNFQATSEPAYTELTQGVQNTIVYSVLTSNPVRCSMEVYEFNARTLKYGLGLDGSTGADAQAPLTLKTAITTGGTAIVANATVDPEYDAGDWVMVQDAAGDKVHVGKLASDGVFSTNQVTLTLTAGTAMPTGLAYPITTTLVSRINRIAVGSKTAQPFFSAKVVATLPQDNRPIVILIPKLRITRGFTLAFNSDNFGNLPYEFTPYDLVSTDTFYSDFVTTGPMAIHSVF